MVAVDFPASHATLAGDLWWKTAVIYCLDVQTFYDSNGDGVGDFAGLSQRLDHLVDLGVTVIWLMPCYPTADVDDGYDITDFYTVDPRLGSLGDFVEFVRTAEARGLKVIAELVVNHTSARSSVVPVGALEPGVPVPRLVRLTRRTRPGKPPATSSFPTRNRASGPRTARPGSATAPLLPPPARPERHQSRGPQRDRQDHRVLDGAGPVRVQGGRGAVHAGNARISGGAAALPQPHDFLRDLRAFLSRRNGDAILLGARSTCRTTRPARSSGTATATN